MFSLSYLNLSKFMFMFTFAFKSKEKNEIITKNILKIYNNWITLSTESLKQK